MISRSLSGLINKIRPLACHFRPQIIRYSTRYIMNQHIDNKINLNENESKLRSLLLKFCNHYNESAPRENKLEIRITGGWVRDKLLGKESHDLDIALNNLSGEEFADQLLKYLEKNEPQYVFKRNTIKSNPEKSKHLETCTARVMGFDIDFVNLRSENYSEDSRVPQIKCGTAEEDAFRRDATLNALFYNINRDMVEDFTRRGLDDLRNGILRTPLDPLQTFLDDPLRVLRLIRFASRFNFKIDDLTFDAMKKSEIRTALIHKISRERVGDEFAKTLTSDHVEYGLNLIALANLVSCIFNSGPFAQNIEKSNDPRVSKEIESVSNTLNRWVEECVQLQPFFMEKLQAEKGPLFELQNTVFLDKQQKKLFWLAVTLAPFASLAVKTSPKKSGTSYVSEIILKEGLRYGKNEFDIVSNLVKERELSKNDLVSFLHDTSLIQRSQLGLYLRKFPRYSELNIFFNCFIETLTAIKGEFNEVNEEALATMSSRINEIIISVLKSYGYLVETIIQKDLMNAHEIKPLIDGKTLVKSLGMKPGPWISKATQEIIVWQLDNPEGTPEECLTFIKESLPKFTDV